MQYRPSRFGKAFGTRAIWVGLLCTLGTLDTLGCKNDAPLAPPSPGHHTPAPPRAEQHARELLKQVVPLIQPAFTAANQAAWTSMIDVTEGHSGQRAGAEKVAAAVVGSRHVIDNAKALLKQGDRLEPSTARQLRKLLLAAAETPATIPQVVAKRIEAESAQSKVLDGFEFCDGPYNQAGRCPNPLSANQIDEALFASHDLKKRLKIWEASKAVGVPLKAGLATLVQLRNRVAQEMGYASFFALQVADYGMTVDEMMQLLQRTLDAVSPLYQQLHCAAKGPLAQRYRAKIPKTIPAHWLPNRWGQEWPGVIETKGLSADFSALSPEDIVKRAESFYTSLGFDPLPASFWQKSDLYPVPPDQTRKKNSHASAWHIDGDADVRSLMSVQSNAQWFGTAHHELGHIYYYISYSRPEIPYLLREGANRAFHEGIGELAKLASEQTPYLKAQGLLPDEGTSDAEPGTDPSAQWLLSSAMDSIVFLPFAAGVMSFFERDLYENALPPEQWQSRWWQYVERFQGMTPPGDRNRETLCDACTKTHINDDPAQYYDYALATLIKFQLHAHICKTILNQDPRSCNYAGNKKVGTFLRGILAKGASEDWRTVIKESTGQDIGPQAMMDFYAPLTDLLKTRNAGLDCAW